MQRFTPLRRGLTVGAALALQAFVGGCADKSTGPTDATNAHMVVSAAVAGTPIATLVVEVTGPGITQTLAFNITANNGHASGVIRIPPGVNRTITVRAFDTNGDVTHEGSRVIELVRPGANPDVSIPMVPQPGQIEITVQIGSVQIALNQTNVTLGGGRVALLTATVTAANGDVIPATVSWATTNPAVATVANTGHVTALWEGTTQIVATFAGVAAAANVTVEPCVITAYTFGTSVTGELTASDCHRPPNAAQGLTGRAIDYYRATTSTSRVLQFDQSASYDTWIWQFDGSRSPVGWNDDIEPPLRHSQFRIIIPAGEYLIGASHFSTSSFGAYTLASATASANNAACYPAFFLMAGITTTQQLEPTDCAGGARDQFLMYLRAGQTVTIRMSSTAFDTFLQTSVASNDNAAAGTTNSEVVFTSSIARVISIWPRGNAAGATGAYTLTVE